MSRPDVYVKYEESTPYFQYGGGQWSLSVEDRWSERGQVWPAFAANPERVLGNMTFTFRGTSVAMIGNTPAVPQSQSVRVSIDGSDFYTTSYMDPLPQTYRQWYQSPLLDDGEHTIVFEDIDGTSVDYALVTAGESTPVQAGDSLVIVDDDNDSHFFFKGNWNRDPSMFSGPIDGMPFRNATHRTRTVGDQMFFRFEGTSIALYGIFIWPMIGSITANYSIDASSSTEVTYSSTPGADNAGYNQQPNFPLFQTDALTPGEHTLVMTITDVKNQTFVFDYATYRPSFASIRDMADWGPFTPPDDSATPSTDGGSSSANPSATGAATGGSSSAPVGAIVGGVIGGLALIVAGLIAWWVIRRRRMNNKRESSLNEAGNMPPPMPFTGASNTMAEREPFSDFGAKMYQSRSGSLPQVWTGSQPNLHGMQSHHTLSSSTGSPGFFSFSQTSGSPTATVSPEQQRIFSERQAELRRQMQDLENRIQELNRDTALAGSLQAQTNVSGYGNHEAEILELRRQIEQLRNENALLSTPPAYEEGDRVAGTLSPSSGVPSPQVSSLGNDSIARSSVRALPTPGKRPL